MSREEEQEEDARRLDPSRNPPGSSPDPAAPGSFIRAHPHGAHACLCSNCGHETTVGVGVKCNSVACPQCGASAMLPVEVGERRLQGAPPVINPYEDMGPRIFQEGDIVHHPATIALMLAGGVGLIWWVLRTADKAR